MNKTYKVEVDKAKSRTDLDIKLWMFTADITMIFKIW